MTLDAVCTCATPIQTPGIETMRVRYDDNGLSRGVEILQRCSACGGRYQIHNVTGRVIRTNVLVDDPWEFSP